MELEKTTIVGEINAILEEPLREHIDFNWYAEFKIGDKTYPAIKVVSLDILRDYASAFGDQIYLDCMVGAGTFSHLIFPFKEDIEVVVYRRHVRPEDKRFKPVEENIVSTTYRAIITDPGSKVVESNGKLGATPETGDLLDILTVRMQLLDPTIEQIRMQSVGLIIRDKTTPDALKYLFTEVSKTVESDEENRVQGVSFYQKGLNEEVQKHIVIPHGTPFFEVPDFVNRRSSGIYNAGLGFYLQKKNWFIYPLYNLKRFDEDRRTLTLVKVPDRRLPGTERTYRKTDNQVIALITGAVKHIDDSENQQSNRGNGVRFGDARKMMDGFVEVGGNRARALRALNNNEYIANERKTGLNNARISDIRITCNNFFELSRLARRQGAFIQCLWQNSDIDAIFPGMAVKYVYAENSEVKEVLGVVHQAHHYISAMDSTINSSRCQTNTALLLFVERLVPADAEE